MALLLKAQPRCPTRSLTFWLIFTQQKSVFQCCGGAQLAIRTPAFVVETFIDELAYVAGKDAYEFRRALLRNKPRHLDVLELAARKANWGDALPQGRGRWIALHMSFDTYVAQVAEV